eukprot:m.28747 g.28747  ORF g.28747 m.28747 type:complete len:107 (+) comp8030_c0_seq1:2627-2947(+)
MAGAECGRTTVTGTPSLYPAYAAANPAFPPDEDIMCFVPFATAFCTVLPIPLILKDPEGCKLSNLRNTEAPYFADNGMLFISGVLTCNAMFAFNSLSHNSDQFTIS